ncbi:unnamed protein product [Rotaria sp. Silwood1]|nr:unnamed protein product [Rotaria sp. Silwood1]CAF3542810.1 unnamed protein product [Rotaria sp. Silwood1]CAF3568937.1 unnamed protein product [Rotaria sp. Silwood1]CAF3583716.1 unnamed protein product [Rotaria sp. Silwood1]CAF4626154.1 unnamed protein product [Rotaria sp. Silwood1]
MSSVNYGNEGITSNNETTNPSGTILQHPYLNPNANVAYAAAAVAAAAVSSSSTVGPYQHYYDHTIPSQQLLHMQPTVGFYPTTTTTTTTVLNHHQHHTDFNNSSPSIASSSSSIESSRKTTNRKRNTIDSEKLPGITLSTKTTTKRKQINDDNIDDDDDDEENKCYLRGAPIPNILMSTNHPHSGTGVEEDKEKQARENHCEIERRRRIKMATYFAELCDMVPSCSNLARKPDKLTILRMAAQFMKNLRTNNNSLPLNSTQISQQPQIDLHKPSFLNDQELKYLMVESCDAFLFALNCDNLRIIYVSDAIQNILSYTCQDWYSRYFYDFVHPDDVEKLREQLNLQPQDGNTNGNGRVLDLKTGTIKKDAHTTGARSVSSKRSFICRLRVGSANPLDHTHQNPFINPCILRRRHRTSLGPSIDGHLYEVVHISGYIRNLNIHHHPSSHHDNPSSSTSTTTTTTTTATTTSSNSNGQMAFIAIARIQNSCSPNVNDLTNGSISSLNCLTTEFTCRCNSDTSEILFIDQRCTPIIGYKTHELLHKILYDQIHIDDQIKFQDLFKRTVTQKNLSNTSSNLTNIIVRFRTNIDNEYISLKTSTYAFCNPCTDDIEFIIVTFLSNQTTNKTSVITNSNDYNRLTYETYTRNSSAIVSNPITRYSQQSPSTYNNQDGQDYSTGNGNNDGRTYVSNNGGSAWASANENWTTGNSTTTSTDYVDTPATLALYHQYHQ